MFLHDNHKFYLIVSIAISAGEVTFSVIGSDEARHFVIFGLPIQELKNAKKVSLPSDLVLSLSAWQHCTPSQYEYVIKDPLNIKIIRVLKKFDATSVETLVTDVVRSSSPYKTSLISITGKENYETEITNKKDKASTVITAIAAENPNFVTHLKSYLLKPVIQQIEKGEPLRFLAEIRRITVISVNIIPDKYSNSKFSFLVDKCFQLLHSNVTQYGGCINTMNLYEKNIFFCIAFGVREYSSEDQFKTTETCKNGIICATHIKRTVKTINGVRSTFIGVSTGIAYCGVIGHTARRYYAIIGPPVDKAVRIMNISHEKISCDYDTVLHSHFRKEQFRSRGVRTLQRLEKYHIYEYLDDEPKILEATSSLDYCYPILGRADELECFDDILDEIGVADRKYSGLLIEGIERSGKSRLLDAFVTSVCNRQIRPIKLSLHVTYADKAYSVMYHLILQILEAEDCDTVEEREKELLNKLGDIVALEDFCYLNILMRVCFPLSDAYCSDTDWRRHTKTVDIFEKILKQLKTKLCILLDDIQYMDHRSWQFLSSALDNYNIVIAMTMPKPKSWDDLTHVEAEIYKDKRLIKHMLHGLDIDLLPVFACQFLNVLAISQKLSRILQKHKDGHIGWCEVFLTSILQKNGLDIIKISPSEAIKRNLVFPRGTLVTKLPVTLTPEELAPPLPWSQMKLLDVCVINENNFKITDGDRNMTELTSEIYDKMNPYEQDFIKCAATLGRVFKRNIIENIMVNSIPLLTARTVSEMIRMRILECASLQRRDFHTKDLLFCIDKKRKTFSDMHHLLFCNCYHSPVFSRYTPPFYAYCKLLEFRIDSFYKMMYNIQTNEEKQKHHTKAVRIYEVDARKCHSCGNSRFLRVPSEDALKELLKKKDVQNLTQLNRRRTLIEDKWKVKPKIYFRPKSRKSLTKIGTRKQEFVDVCRVSIMPSIDDEKDEEEETEEEINKSVRFGKRSTSIFPEMTEDPSHHSYLENFTHIDYRNCQCDNVVAHLFWKLHQHIEKSSENEQKVLEFFIEYGAGLIQIAQPLYAIKLLSIAAEKSRAADVDEWIDENAEDNIMNKGIILALMGDAYSALGNYDQAKKYYLSAVKLRGTPPKEKGACYNIMSKMFCKLQEPPRYVVEDSGQLTISVKRLELALYLRRLCIIFMIENKLKTAQSFALRSFKLAFLSINSFLEKGEIYLATVRVLHCTRNIKLIRRIERLMLTTIRRNAMWNDVEEIARVANVYLTMYQISILRGELEEAIEIGIKVLKISGTLHLNKLMLITMPSLIQIMLWTKRVNEAVDLIQELYFLADEDVDLSAKTWYYALSLDLMLDAGIVLESYETSYNYYEKFIGKNCDAVCIDALKL
ncbi:adenylate cyclase type 10 [Monomorium pharaonis]|uniref:adenylate cyclase type 10 n=1 Tax=Monomorium pharaonis TaxID=307658 RepID=UPI0017473A01|nr:adenylate cyclase type 10 [Monomorium pharaonis]